MIEEVKDIIAKASHDKNYKLSENLSQIRSYKQKLAELTYSYSQGNIGLDVFTLSSEHINKAIIEVQTEIRAMEDHEEYIKARRKTMRFIEIL